MHQVEKAGDFRYISTITKKRVNFGPKKKLGEVCIGPVHFYMISGGFTLFNPIFFPHLQSPSPFLGNLP